MTDDEIRRMLQDIPGRRNSRFTFRLGDIVRINSGPFTAFTGKVEGIKQAKGLVKVLVNIYGRDRAIRLRFLDVEKV